MPKTQAEFNALLDEALRLSAQLERTLDAVFPGGRIAPELDLSKLTLDEKLALGDKAAAELGALAFKVSPETLLDRLEEGLSTDKASSEQATTVLHRLANPD